MDKKTQYKSITAKILLSLVVLLVAISFVSAIEYNPFATKMIEEKSVLTDMSDNIKDGFNEKYGVIRLSNTFFWFETDKIAEYSLTENTEYCSINCEAEGKVTLYSDGILFDGVEFKNLSGSLTSIKSSGYFLFDGYEDNYIDVPDQTKEVCIDLEINETNKDGGKSCQTEIITYKKENHPIEKWINYNGEILKAGDYRWKIKGTKDQMQSVDFIPIRNSNKFTAWATWTSSFNVGLRAYLTLDETTGTRYDSLGVYNITPTGTPGVANGKSGNAWQGSNPGTYGTISGKLINNTNQISVSFWYNTTSVTAKQDRFFGIAGDYTKFDYRANSQGTPGGVDINFNGQPIMVTGGLGFNDGIFHNYVFTATSGGRALLYADGVLKDNETAGTFTNMNDQIAFGWDGGDVGYELDNKEIIDEVAVWNRTLSSSEISDLATGIFYTNTFLNPAMTITNDNPINMTNISTSSVTFGCNATATDQNITSIVLSVSNGVSWTQTISALNTPQYNATFTNSTLTDGSYSWNCTSYGDGGINATSTSWNFTKDATAPIITITYPINKTYDYVINSLNFTATDNHLRNCWFYNGSTNITISCILNITNNNSIEGNNIWIIYANDTFGNIASQIVNFGVDTLNPLFAITYPLAQNYSAKPSALNYTLDHITGVMDSCWYVTNLALPIYITCGNNVTGLSAFAIDGDNNWTIYGNDTANNLGSSTVLFYVDSADPNVVITSPTNKVYNTTSIVLSATITDPNLATCFYSLNGGVNTTYTCNVNTNLVGVQGNNSLYVYANDTFAHRGSVNLTFRIDITNPNAILVTPVNNSWINYSAVNFTANISDNIGIANYTLTVINKSGYVVNQTFVDTPTNPLFSMIGIVINMLDGMYNWYYDVYDMAGNFFQAGSYNATVDATYPLIDYGGGVYPTGSHRSDSLIYVNTTWTENNFHTIQFSLTGTETDTHTYASPTYAHTFSSLSEGSYDYIVEICDQGHLCNSTASRNIVLDRTAPTLTLNNLPDVSGLILPINTTFDVTTADLYIGDCWYNTSDNSTRIYYTCNVPQNVTFRTAGAKTITISANDTANNLVSATYPVNVYNFNYSQTGDAISVDGSSETFTLLVNSAGLPIVDADAVLWYNGANIGVTTKTIVNTSAISFTKVLSIPTGTGNTTGKAINWFWEYDTTYLTSRNTTTQTQTVYNISISDCADTGGKVILNMSLRDEELNDYINLSAGSNLEIDLSLTSLINSSQQFLFHKHWVNNQSLSPTETFAVCVPNEILNYSSYKIDFTIGYDGTDHVREFYYMDNGTLDNTNNFNSYTTHDLGLMDLLTADSTTFLFEFTDADNLKVDNAIIHTYREYIGEALFREVERSRQDNNGQTHVHLVEEDVIYYFMVTQYGKIIYTSDTYNAKCLSAPCEITLSASPTEANWSLIDNEGGAYQVSTNKALRTTTTHFELDTISLVNISLYKVIDGQEVYINKTSITATAGSLTLHVPLAYGNNSFFVAIYKNNTFIKSAYIDMTENGKNYFGTTGAILGGMLVLTMMLMAVSEGAGFIIFTALALIIIGVLKLVDLGWASLIAIICAGGIILWKLVNRKGVSQ